MKLAQKLALGAALTTSVIAVKNVEAAADELVDVSTLVHDLIVKKPYATTNNFTGKVIYPASDTELVTVCKMRESSAKKIDKADDYLKTKGNGERIIAGDCGRPNYAQEILWEAFGCVENPSKCSGYIAYPGKSRHESYGAIDMALADKDGKPLPFPTKFDDFSKKAHLSSFSTWSVEAQENWTLMNDAMTHAGCTVNRSEWWHYDC